MSVQARRCRRRCGPASGSSRISDSAVIDLPQPDSPTSAKHLALAQLEVDAVDRAHAPAARCRARYAGSVDLQGHTGTVTTLHAWIEAVAHRVGEQVGREHQHEHEDERRRQRPPDDRLAAPSPGARR